MKFRPKPTRKVVGVGLKSPPAHLAPTAPIPATASIGEATPRFRRDPKADVLPVNAHVIGGAARLAADLTAGERERQTRFSAVCTVAEGDVDLRPARAAAAAGGRPTRRPYVPAGHARLVLEALRAGGPQTAPEIARRTGLRPQSLPQVLLGLETRRLVIRTAQTRDTGTSGVPARIWVLAATTGGQAA